MKTNSIFFPGIKALITLILLISFFQPKANSQSVGAIGTPKKSILQDLSVNTNISGNGFGFNYTPMAGFRLGNKILLSAGPIFRFDRPDLTGWISHLRVNLLSPENSFSQRTSLYLVGSHKLITKQFFGENQIEIEEWISRKEINKTDFKEVNFRGYETALGFGVTHNVTDRFCMGIEFRVSVYKVKRNNYEQISLYHQPKGFNNQITLVTRINISK